MRLAVTGGAGFIGSHLARRLSNTGHDVLVFDNLSTGEASNLDGAAVELVVGDMRDRGALELALQDAQVVFHLAALPSVARSVEDPRASHEVNATGTLNVLEAARRAGIQRVVYASSSSIYGSNPALPKEENMRPAPMSPYAASKLAGEHYCRVYAEVYGLETVALRYFNVFGPRQDPTSQYSAVIPRFVTALLENRTPSIYGDGEQTRDFTFIDNVVHANELALEADSSCSGQWMNIACGEETSLNDLLQVLADILGLGSVEATHESSRVGDVRHSVADISRAGELIGYRPIVGLREGLAKTASWFQGSSDAEAHASYE